MATNNQEASRPRPEEWFPLNPAELEKEIAEHRLIFCSKYDHCLTLAVEERWQGFSCFWCPLKKKKEI